MERGVTGRCHCGALEFRVAELPTVAVRCNCSYCVRRGWYTGYSSVEEFELVKGAEALRSYRFAAGTTENFFCGECGIHTHFYTTYTDPPRYAYSLACIDELDVFSLELQHIDMKSV